MTSDAKPNTTPNANLRLGLLLMAVAMLAIPMVDGLAKFLSADYSPLFISWVRYAMAACIIVPIGVFRFGRHFLPTTQLPAHFLRTCCLVGAMTLYFLAIARVPMATAASAFFVSPILATVLAVVFFGERLSIWKVLALVLGFVGVLIIAKPGADLQPGILLALASGIAFAAYLVATRLASRESDPIKTLAFQCLVGAILLLPQALLTWQLPTIDVLHLFLLLGVLSVVCHLLSIAAFRYAETSVLAPLVYLELVGAVVIGYLFFGDFPTPSVWLGALFIVVAGLLLSRRSKAVG